MDPQEKKLYEKIKSGDEKAFESLFKAYYDSLLNYAFEIIKDYHIAEEIVGEVFIKMWEQRTKIVITTSIKSYLFKSVYNTCLNHIKHVKVKNKYKAYFYHHADFNKSDDYYPLAKVIENELEVKIEETISGLPEKCREIFMLSRFNGKKNDEIAKKLDISITTVKTQISRALKKMREALTEYYMIIAYLIFFY